MLQGQQFAYSQDTVQCIEFDADTDVTRVNRVTVWTFQFLYIYHNFHLNRMVRYHGLSPRAALQVSLQRFYELNPFEY